MESLAQFTSEVPAFSNVCTLPLISQKHSYFQMNCQIHWATDYIKGISKIGNSVVDLVLVVGSPVWAPKSTWPIEFVKTYTFGRISSNSVSCDTSMLEGFILTALSWSGSWRIQSPSRERAGNTHWMGFQLVFTMHYNSGETCYLRHNQTLFILCESIC